MLPCVTRMGGAFVRILCLLFCCKFLVIRGQYNGPMFGSEPAGGLFGGFPEYIPTGGLEARSMGIDNWDAEAYNPPFPISDRLGFHPQPQLMGLDSSGYKVPHSGPPPPHMYSPPPPTQEDPTWIPESQLIGLSAPPPGYRPFDAPGADVDPFPYDNIFSVKDPDSLPPVPIHEELSGLDNFLFIEDDRALDPETLEGPSLAGLGAREQPMAYGQGPVRGFNGAPTPPDYLYQHGAGFQHPNPLVGHLGDGSAPRGAWEPNQRGPQPQGPSEQPPRYSREVGKDERSPSWGPEVNEPLAGNRQPDRGFIIPKASGASVDRKEAEESYREGGRAREMRRDTTREGGEVKRETADGYNEDVEVRRSPRTDDVRDSGWKTYKEWKKHEAADVPVDKEGSEQRRQPEGKETVSGPDGERRYKDGGRQYKDEGKQSKGAGRQYKDEGRQYKDEGRQYKDEGRQYKDEGRQYKDEGRQYRDTSGARYKPAHR